MKAKYSLQPQFFNFSSQPQWTDEGSDKILHLIFNLVISLVPYCDSTLILLSFIGVLEIKPCGLGSRIRDMEAEWRLNGG